MNDGVPGHSLHLASHSDLKTRAVSLHDAAVIPTLEGVVSLAEPQKDSVADSDGVDEEDEEEEEEQEEEEEEEDEEEEEEEEEGCIQAKLEALSLQNKTYRPYRDGRESEGSLATFSSISTASTTRPRSYLHEQNRPVVRKLVKRAIARKHKQQQRQARGRKGTKPPTPAGCRSKKGNRTALKQAADSYDW